MLQACDSRWLLFFLCEVVRKVVLIFQGYHAPVRSFGVYLWYCLYCITAFGQSVSPTAAHGKKGIQEKRVFGITEGEGMDCVLCSAVRQLKMDRGGNWGGEGPSQVKVCVETSCEMQMQEGQGSNPSAIQKFISGQISRGPHFSFLLSPRALLPCSGLRLLLLHASGLGLC